MTVKVTDWWLPQTRDKQLIKSVMQQCERIADDAFTTGNPWGESTFATEIEKPSTSLLMLYAVDMPVAFIMSEQIIDEHEIGLVAVSREYQGNRIGTRLVRSMVEHFPNEKFFLEVRSQNQAAIQVYERCGFECYRTRESYYQNPSDTALMMMYEGELEHE